MFKYKNITVRTIYILIDLICIVAAIYLACLFRPKTLPFEISLNNVFLSRVNPYRSIFFFWVVSTILLLNSRSLYQTRRELFEGFEIGVLFRSVIFSAVIVVLAIFAFKIHGFPRTIFFIATILQMLFLSIWRVIKRLLVEYMVTKGYNNSNVLIIGAGKVGLALSNEIKKHPGMGLKVIGFLDDFKNDKDVNHGHKVLGKIADFPNIVKKEFIDKVFITVHHDSRVFLKLLEQAKQLRTAVRVVPQGFELMTGDFYKYNIGIIPILEYCDAIPLKIQVGKRLFDFIFGLSAIMILSPLYFFIYIMIKKDSPGPAIYVSKRYGKNGRMFNMYKFRSMRPDADKVKEEIKILNEVDGPIFKIKDDPRVTPIGKILRKYSLDELPQLFNVIKGEMSLVGPRPLPIDQVEKEDFMQLKRLEVRPGITGLWQIKGRSDISFRRLVRWDMWYINNWSFWLDLNILFQTIPVVFRGRGAY